jgi:hypothetical protein
VGNTADFVLDLSLERCAAWRLDAVDALIFLALCFGGFLTHSWENKVEESRGAKYDVAR